MKTVTIIISLIMFFGVGFVASSQGFDIRKRSSWFYSAISFLCGFAGSFSLQNNLVESLKGGAIFAIMTMYVGVVMRSNKKKTENITTSLLSQYKNNELPPLLAKMIKRILDVPFVKKIFDKHK